MRSRRSFCQAMVVGVAGAALPATTLLAKPSSGWADRTYWLGIVEKISSPVLESLARRELRRKMPVETFGSVEKLRKYTHLEAISRLLVGLAPWFALQETAGGEGKLRNRLLHLAQESLDSATDPGSPDFMNFSEGQQPLVDTAFLAQAVLRAPRELFEDLDKRVQRQVSAALKASRGIKPINNNHILFSAVIEAALLRIGEPTREERLEGYLRQMLAWYRGDGVYADGEYFRFDYYNSFVIHPTLVDIFGLLKGHDPRFAEIYEWEMRRSIRYAEIQERLIAPDGSYPAVGRSITYRFGAFQTLGQMALMQRLPERVTPAQVRCALTAVIRRMMEAPETFNREGWLNVGFCGHQVSQGDNYISTGSLYLCSVGLLPLGLPATARFWSDPAAKWTSQKLWSGESLPADRALKEDKPVEIPTLKRDANGEPEK